MRNYSFTLIDKTKKIIDYYSKVLSNYANEDRLEYQNIFNNLYNLLYYLYSYMVYDTNKEKIIYLKRYVSKLELIDYNTSKLKRKVSLTRKELKVIYRSLNELRRLALELMKGIEDGKL